MCKFLSTSIFCFLFYFFSYSQALIATTEPFSIASLWKGNTNDFSLTDGKIQLRASGSNSGSFLSSPCQIASNSAWLFDVHLEFNPSNQNYLDIYLMADEIDPNGHILGYFVRIGGSEDNISLYRRDGKASQVSRIIKSQNGITDKEKNHLRIKITRDDSGLFNLFYSLNSANPFIPDGEAQDKSYHYSNFMILHCIYTPSRSNKFYFEKIQATGDYNPDYQVPVIDTVVFDILGRIICLLSEKINPTSSCKDDNFILPGLGHPDTVIYDPSAPSIILSYSNLLQNNEAYTLEVKQLADWAGNFSGSLSFPFIYFRVKNPQPGDIVFNEILADPTPSRGIPEYEYVELINKSKVFIELSGLRFNQSEIDRYIIQPDQVVLLCADTSNFPGIRNKVRTISSWPVINNSGEWLILSDQSGEVIDRFFYDPVLFDSQDQKSGGFSLELINSQYSCWGHKSWKVTLDPEGGTPGRINSRSSETIINPYKGIESVSVESENSIEIVFHDPISNESFSSLEKYMKSDQLRIHHIQPDPESFYNLKLQFNDPLDTGQVNSLFLTGLYDCSHTYTIDTCVYFGIGKRPRFSELLITEIMFDEFPVAGLPETEYLELLNPTNVLIDVRGVQLICNEDTTNLVPGFLLPQQYMILCPRKYQNDLKTYGTTMGLDRFPVLNNSGEKIILIGPDNDPLHYINYKESWFSGLLPEGGFSIEMIDFSNPCGQANNWLFSTHPSGGTPGYTNSVNSNNPDLTGPKILSVYAQSEFEIYVEFSEMIYPGSILASDISINDMPFSGSLYLADFQGLQINPLTSLPIKKENTIKLRNLLDCTGNYTIDAKWSFYIPESPDSGDVVISEILFNSNPGGMEFIEIYNRSNKYLNLNEFKVAAGNRSSSIKKIPIASNHLVVPPDSYWAITRNKNQLSNDFPEAGITQFIQTKNLPNLPDDEGFINIFFNDEEISDLFYYSEKYHNLYLSDTEGISLERISPEQPTNDPGNWSSAGENSGYGTPGYINSQSIRSENNMNKLFVDPPVFSPDQSGFDDFTELYYYIGEPGYIGNIKIFSAEGKLVRYLANNTLLSVEGSFLWDGKTETGQTSPVGYYIILFEAFNRHGTKVHLKEKVAVVENF